MPAASRHQRVFLPVLGGLVTLAWATLWLWTRSPYGRYLDHGDWTASGPAAWLCSAVPGGSLVVPAALYALAWTLMTLAMMLPTTLPLFQAFDRVVAGERIACACCSCWAPATWPHGAPSACSRTACTRCF